MGHIWKRTLALLLAAVLVLGVLPGMTVKAEAAGTAWKQFYVSPDGNDDNNGATAETAFATIGRARDAVDAVNEDMKGDIVVNVAPGTYYVTETINFDESDSGMNGYEVVYRCTGDPGSARILGGRAVTETWELATADDPDLSPDMVGKVWKVELPVDTVDFNTLYVDGSRATMARTPNAANDPRFPAGKDTYLYATGGASGGYGISVPGGTLTAAQREAVTAAIARGEEGCQVLGWDWGYHNWFTSTLPITGISGNTLTSTPVEGNPQANRPKYVFTSGARFFLQGNLSFLDVPGEYHYNKQTNTLYYYPAEGEDLRTVEVIIPQVQEIFHLESASLDKLDVSQASDPEKQVHNLTFYGLEAGYTDFTDSYSSGWNAFDTYGCGVYPEEALREGITQPSYCEQTERAEHRKGVFTLFQTNHITLDSMRIVNTGYMGFCAWGNNDHITIQNSEFSHIGFHGINIDGGYPGPESGKYSYGHLVTNNVIHDMGELVGHGTGIQALQLHDSEFSHMEMYNAARRAIFLEGAWACRTAQDADFNRVRDSATYNNHLEYLYLHDLQQDGGDDGAIFVCTLYRYQTGYAGNGVDDTKPNYLDQIYMDAVGAPSSNKDFKPNCINFDMGCGGVIASNIKAVNPQHYNIRYNEGQGEVTFENVNMAYYHPMADSNYKNFDESKMEYDQIGVNSSFPYPDAVTHLTEKTYEDVYYREEFDNGFEDWWTLAGAPENSPLYFSDNADWAGKCFLADAFYNKSADGCRIGKPFGVDLNKVVEIDFFDHMCDGMENGYCGMTFQYNLNSFARVDNGSAVRAMGVDTSVSFQYFCYKIGSITRVSSVPRAYGWHTLKWDYTDGTNVKMYIDDVLVATVPSASFNYIEMGDYGMGGFNAYDNVVIYGGQYAEDPMPLPEQPEPEAPEEETLTLPGRIEAEDTDTLPSTARIDSGYGTGKAITYVSVGDEYCYDVTVTEDMDLPFVVSCAVNGSAKLEVYVDGEASPRMTLTPANGNSWTKFKDTIGENLKLSAGTHTIKIKVLNNALNIDYFECKQPVKATSVQAEVNGDLILGKDTSVKVPVLVLPENASEKAVTWSSDNTGVVTVDADGTLHTLAVGEANITVKLASGESVSDTFTVKVEDAEAYLISTTEKGCVPSADVPEDHVNYKPEKLIDGILTKYGWAACGSSHSSHIEDPSAFFTWNKAQTVQTIMLYDAVEGDNYVENMEIVFFDAEGKELKTVSLPGGVPDGGMKTVTLEAPLSGVAEIQFHILKATARFGNYGFAEIKVYSAEPGVIPVNAVSFGGAGVNLFPGDSYILKTPVAVPSTATNTQVTVTLAEGEGVISLTANTTDGLTKSYTIKALQKGKATIRATAANGVCAEFTVMVGTRDELANKIIEAENLYAKYPGPTAAHTTFRKAIDKALKVYNNSTALDEYAQAVLDLQAAMEAFEAAFVTELTAADAASAIVLTTPAKGQTSLDKPAMPDGFTVKITNVEPEGIINKSWGILPPDADAQVTLTLLATKIQDGTTAEAVRTVTVPGYGPQEVLDTVSIESPVKGQTQLTMPAVPKGFTLSIAASTDNLVAADGSFELPLYDTQVRLTVRVTKDASSTYAEKQIAIIIPGVAKRLNTNIEANQIDAVSGSFIKIQNNEVINFNAGNWIRYDYVDFGTNAKEIEFSVNLAVHPDWAGKHVLVKLDAPDGETLADITVQANPEGGGWGVYYMHQAEFIRTISGVHTIYLVGAPDENGAGEGVGGVREIRFDVLAEAGDSKELEALLAHVEGLNQEDYTEESWAGLTEALEAAEKVLENPVASQAELDKAAEAVRRALESLEVSGYVITVTQNRGGVITPDTSVVKAGADVEFTIEANFGYIVTDVLVDGASVGPVDSFTFRNVRANHTMEAEFEFVLDDLLLLGGAGGAGDFVDVQPGGWFYDAVDFVAAMGLMNGTSSNTFSPELTTTRGMIVTILYRHAGSPSVISNGTEWWSDARVWAMENGLSDGTNMEGKITREQLAAMLYRYAAYRGMNTAARSDLGSFADADNVSDWAADAMQWAVAAGILNGKTGGCLDPQGNATRAEVAAMLQRFCKLA